MNNIMDSTGFGTSLCASNSLHSPHLLFSLHGGFNSPRVQYLLQNKIAPIESGYSRDASKCSVAYCGAIPQGAFQSLSADDYVLANSNFISTLDKLLSNNNTEQTEDDGVKSLLMIVNGFVRSLERELANKPHCFRYVGCLTLQPPSLTVKAPSQIRGICLEDDGSIPSRGIAGKPSPCMCGESFLQNNTTNKYPPPKNYNSPLLITITSDHLRKKEETVG